MNGENCENKPTCGTPKPMTFGEKAVGLKFNPAGDSNVDKVKKLCAEVIDICSSSDEEVDMSKFEKDLQDRAIMEMVSAQMAAVKYVTWRL